MKTSVRFLSMLLAIVMIAGSALMTSANNAVEISNEEALDLLVNLGIFAGYEDGSLQPAKLVERDEMAKIIFVLSTTFQNAGAGVQSFKDVPANDWSAGFVSWCASKNIIGGFDDGNFRPNDYVTFDQALKMVCGALGYNDWDSNLWPVDVRQQGLVKLDLGKGLEDIDGSAQLTRAQAAQLAYNALFAEMAESDDSDNNSTFPFTQGTKKANTLAQSVWGFKVKEDTIVAAGNIGETVIADDDYDITLKTLGDFALEDLGFTSYANKLDELLYAKVGLFYKPEYMADGTTEKPITLENIHAATVTPAGVKDVEITYDTAKSEILIDEKANKLESDVKLLAFAADGTVTLSAFTQADVPSEDYPYVSVAYDLDDNGKYDYLAWSYLTAHEVTSTSKNSVTLKPFEMTGSTVYDLDDVAAKTALEKGQVIITTQLYKNLKVEQVVAPVVASATKHNSSKVTLKDNGEFKHGEQVFANNTAGYSVPASVMDLDDKGKTAENEYYIYNGVIFGNNAPVKASDLKFAILSYLEKPSAPTFDEDTNKVNSTLLALVTIDGVEQEVEVNPQDVLDGKNFTDNEAELLAYCEKIVDGYLYKYHTLVSYTINEKGLYSFDTVITLPDDPTDPEDDDDYIKIPAGSKLTYSADRRVYEIKDASDALLLDRIIFDDEVVFYQSYTKSSTGAYKYLDTYKKSDLPANFGEIEFTSDVFLMKDDETTLYKFLIGMVDKESVKTSGGPDLSYKTDASKLFYCYLDTAELISEDGTGLNYAYYMKPLSGENLPEQIDREHKVGPGVVAPVLGGIYYYDEATELYVQVTKATLATQGITCINAYNLADVLDGCLFTKDGEWVDGIKVDPNAHLWKTTNGAYNSYAAITVDEIASQLQLAKDGGKELKVLIGTRENENGEKVLCNFYMQWWAIAADGSLTSSGSAGTLMSKFGF